MIICSWCYLSVFGSLSGGDTFSSSARRVSRGHDSRDSNTATSDGGSGGGGDEQDEEEEHDEGDVDVDVDTFDGSEDGDGARVSARASGSVSSGARRGLVEDRSLSRSVEVAEVSDFFFGSGQ